MKTIEIEVKIPSTENALNNFIKGDINGLAFYNQLYGDDLENHLKAKVIVYLPENKIELSESCFDKALSGIVFETKDINEAMRLLTLVKQKLFTQRDG